MRFNPQDYEEKVFKALPEGAWKGIITKAKENISKSGNEQIVITLTVTHDGEQYYVRDYLPGIPKMLWKLNHMLDSAALLDKFDAGNISPDNLEGKQVMFISTIELNQNGEPQTKLKDYIKREAWDGIEASNSGATPPPMPAAPSVAEADAILNDDIPF